MSFGISIELAFFRVVIPQLPLPFPLSLSLSLLFSPHFAGRNTFPSLFQPEHRSALQTSKNGIKRIVVVKLVELGGNLESRKEEGSG